MCSEMVQGPGGESRDVRRVEAGCELVINGEDGIHRLVTTICFPLHV